MKTMTNKRWFIITIEFFGTELISIILQKILTINTENMTLKDIIDNAIIIGTCIAFIIVIATYLYWYFIGIKRHIKYLSVKSKYYDIMLTKFIDQQPGSIYGVFEKDFILFSKDERQYLDTYLKNLNNLRIYMKGTNTTLGQFM